MPFTRKFLSALGIEADKVDEIIIAHTEVTDALKAERDKYKADAEKLPTVQQELDQLKEANGKDSYKVKYDALKEDFDKFKSDQQAKETKEAKSAAYRKLLKDAGIVDKRIESVLKVSNIDSIELNKDGSVKDSEKLMTSIKTEWADFISSESSKGATSPNPPPHNGGTVMTRDDVYKRDDHGRFLLDASQRQAALAQINAAEQQKG